MRALYFVLASTLVTLAHSGQARVWTVDDDPASMPDFTDLQSAITSAAEGDILLVKDGRYSYLTIDAKSLTIQADEGATVLVQTPCCAHDYIRNLGISQSVRLRGLRFSTYGQLEVSNNNGVVWIEDCEVGFGIHVRSSSDVILIRTRSTGRGIPDDCSTDYGVRAGSGLECILGSPAGGPSAIHAFGCTFRGGDGGTVRLDLTCYNEPGGAGISGSDAGAFLYLSDCTVTGGDADIGCGYYGTSGLCKGNDSGHGLVWAGTASILDSTLSGGALPPQYCGLGSCDRPGSQGLPVFSSGTVDFLPGEALRMRVASPVRENGTVEAVIEGPPFTAVWILGHPRPDPVFRPALSGTMLVTSPAQIEFAGATDASGRLVHVVPLPMLLPGQEGRIAFGQAMYLDLNNPSVVSGTRARQAPARLVLGEGSMLVGLDESF